MGYINRFLLFLYSLAIAVLALGLIVVCLKIVPMYVLINEIKFVLSRQELLIGAGIAFAWSIYFIGYVFCTNKESAKNQKDVILLKGTSGSVQLSTEAIKNMVERAALSVRGVREVKSKISAQNQGSAPPKVAVSLQLILSHEQAITTVSDEVRNAVTQDMEKIIGVSDYTINLEVSDISNAAVSKKQRVV